MVNEGRGLNELKKEVLYEGRGGKIVSLAKMVNGQSLGFLSPYVWIDRAKVVQTKVAKFLFIRKSGVKER